MASATNAVTSFSQASKYSLAARLNLIYIDLKDKKFESDQDQKLVELRTFSDNIFTLRTNFKNSPPNRFLIIIDQINKFILLPSITSTPF